MKPWTRINPYLVGLLLGYIISRKVYLTRKPNFVRIITNYFFLLILAFSQNFMLKMEQITFSMIFFIIIILLFGNVV